MSLFQLVVVAVYFHVIVLFGAFETHFKSPIVQVEKRYKYDESPLAKRVVLIIADGLRARDAYSPDNVMLVPHLSKIRYRRGSWAVSHSSVPTESRPGHVAILAGVYEDPSAITTGWQKNPVEFDSVINQSHATWAWGSPDILKMFERIDPKRVHLFMYDTTMQQDFGKDSAQLDLWVMDKVIEAFETQKAGDCLEFCEDGQIFILHLLGMDTVGHSTKPGSNEYYRNLRIVDLVVQKVEEEFESYFDDNTTTYIFTADHGMTDWGSHGSGTPDEIDTPFIIWGSHVAEHQEKFDIQQVDIAPLIAGLLGINFPANSFGQFPYKFLKADPADIANIMYANVMQTFEIYNTLQRNLQRTVPSVLFFAFESLSFKNIRELIYDMEFCLNEGSYEMALQIGSTVIKRIFEGISYYHNYFQRAILAALTLSFIFWLCYLILQVTPLQYAALEGSPVRRTKLLKSIPIALFAIIVAVIHGQSLPYSFYTYFTLPLIIAYLILGKYEQLCFGVTLLKTIGLNTFVRIVAVYCIELIAIVQMFYYPFSYVFILCGLAGWVFTLSIPKPMKFEFALACLVVSLFAYIPSVKFQFNTPLFFVNAFVWISAISWIFDVISNRGETVKVSVYLQITLMLLALGLVFLVRIYNYTTRYTEIIAWHILAGAFITPLCYPGNTLFHQLRSVVSGFMAFYFLMSMSYEPLFVFCYSCLLYKWIKVEDYIKIHGIVTINPTQTLNRNVEGANVEADLRQTYFYFSITLIGFFGLGNIASLNSFDPMWTKCYTTVFSPFTMSALILLKHFVPFIFSTCAFRCIQIIRRAQIVNLFTILLMFCDFLVLIFLYQLRNVGSWLDIGLSIANFLISICTTLVLLLTYGLACLYLPHQDTAMDFY